MGQRLWDKTISWLPKIVSGAKDYRDIKRQTNRESLFNETYTNLLTVGSAHLYPDRLGTSHKHRLASGPTYYARARLANEEIEAS